MFSLILQLWVSLAEHSTKRLDWNSVSQVVFSEYSTPEDDSLGTQIVKVLLCQDVFKKC